MRKLAAFQIACAVTKPTAESTDDIPRVVLTWDEIQSQLADWDTPPDDRTRKGSKR